MAKKYTGSLNLNWYNKTKSILLASKEDHLYGNENPAPSLDWINKDEALVYEINIDNGLGVSPFWVERSDIRIKESRPLIFQNTFAAELVNKKNTLPGTIQEYKVKKNSEKPIENSNILIKGDNLLALNSIKKLLVNLPENDKPKCIYIDPPYNTGSAFEHYDDNLEQSEWLTLMRDRLVLLHEVLAKDGVIFVQISDRLVGYLQVLLDEIFGRNNFINKITVRTKSPSGFQTVNLGVFETAEYILLYGREKSKFLYKQQFTECDYDNNYNKIILNKNETPNKWQITSLIDFIAKEEGFGDSAKLKKAKSKAEIERIMADYALQNAESVFRLTAISDTGAGQETVSLKYKSKEEPNRVFVQKRDDFADRYIYNGQEIAFYSKKIKMIDGVKKPTIPLTNIWTDIAWEGISNEGNVSFQRSKKPEKLLKRIIEMSTNEKDVVLDCFGGSGTTFAVAHKLNRRWIGVELGNHADSHIIERLKSVLSGEDKSGISKDVGWMGGGSFNYYHLGNSIIKIDKKSGLGDFNWKLSTKFIELSLLQSYDFEEIKSDELSPRLLFMDGRYFPTIGKSNYGSKLAIAIVSLNPPDGKLNTMSFEEVGNLYDVVKDKWHPERITIFTNRGIEIAFDSKPDNLEIIKVPHAIFAELEK